MLVCWSVIEVFQMINYCFFFATNPFLLLLALRLHVTSDLVISLIPNINVTTELLPYVGLGTRVYCHWTELLCATIMLQ